MHRDGRAGTPGGGVAGREAMVAELSAALTAGAFGFGTSRGSNHVHAYGEPVVSRHADDADVCVLDLERLSLGPVERRDDLPGGAQRLFQTGIGYRAVLVNGAVALLDDEPTGRRGGDVLRSSA